MKRTIAALLCAGIAFGLLAGCGRQAGAPGGATFTASNDIFTYEPLDPGKTALVISRTGNISVDALCEAFEAANPDVQTVVLDVTGGDGITTPILEWMERGWAPDVVVAPSNLFTGEQTARLLENLSTSPAIASYQMEALNRVAVDANIYWLPGPSRIDCLAYNKTLFEKYGWAVPETFDEFVALCVQIREDTGGAIEPWNPNAKYDSELLTALQAFVYGELFGGVDNRAWYREFTSGRGTFAGHMEPFYAAIQTLVDNAILREEHFSYSATSRGKEFLAGQIAIVNMPVSLFSGEAFEFSCMPFPGKAEGDAYLSDSISCCLGVPRKERSGAAQSATDRFVAFFSSVEGQRALIGDALMVSHVKNVALSNAESLSALQPAIDAGHMFSKLNFMGEGTRGVALYKDALAIVKGERTGAECIAAVDAEAYVPLAERAAAPAPEAVATAAEDFTILEVSNYFADMYRERAGADIALIANNAAFRGNLMRIFKGELNASSVTVLKPRSLENGSVLTKASMTGRQLLEALNHPLGDGQAANCVYAFSGLKARVAPWKPLGERVLAVSLADGTPIDENGIYTVAFWGGTVYDEHITEILETFEGSFEALLTERLRVDGTIAPAKDGRIELVWE